MADTDNPRVTEATAAVAESPPGRSRRRCPLCQGELIDHGDENPYKKGAHHCNSCGSCWASGMREQREGHMPPLAPEPFEAK